MRHTILPNFSTQEKGVIRGRFPFLQTGWSHWSVVKWNARVLRSGSCLNCLAHGSEPLSSPAQIGQSAGSWSCGGENVRACLGPFYLNWSEPVLFGRSERTNEKGPGLGIQTFNSFQSLSSVHGCSIQNFCFPKLVSLIFTHSILIKMMQFDKEMHFNEPNCQDQHILAL